MNNEREIRLGQDIKKYVKRSISRALRILPINILYQKNLPLVRVYDFLQLEGKIKGGSVKMTPLFTEKPNLEQLIVKIDHNALDEVQDKDEYANFHYNPKKKIIEFTRTINKKTLYPYTWQFNLDPSYQL